MKILFLMEYPIDLPGGGQLSTWTLCEGLRKNGFEPVVACPTLLDKRRNVFDFKVVEYRSDENRERNKCARIRNFLGRIFSFYRIIKKEKPDLIHVSMSESLITFGFLRCLGIFKDIPFVYTDRGLAYGYRRHSKFCIKKTMKYASAMICTTEYNKRLWAKEKMTVPIKVIPNTISSAFDIFDITKRPMMRARYGVAENEFVVGFAGRISEEKDWDFVPVLVKALEEAGVKFKVALVLSVYEQRDEGIAERIRKGITDVIGRDRFIYMHDLSQREIADYYYMVDVFVMSSMFESFGKAAVEAMSRKCSVVSTDVGGLSEVVGKKENLYTKGEIKRFTDRVLKLSTDREELDNDREFFYNRYRNLYTTETHVVRHIKIYNDIINEKRGHRQ